VLIGLQGGNLVITQVMREAGGVCRFRANMEHIRPRPDPWLGIQIKVLTTFSIVASSLGSGRPPSPRSTACVARSTLKNENTVLGLAGGVSGLPQILTPHPLILTPHPLTLTPHPLTLTPHPHTLTPPHPLTLTHGIGSWVEGLYIPASQRGLKRWLRVWVWRFRVGGRRCGLEVQ